MRLLVLLVIRTNRIPTQIPVCAYQHRMTNTVSTNISRQKKLTDPRFFVKDASTRGCQRRLEYFEYAPPSFHPPCRTVRRMHTQKTLWVVFPVSSLRQTINTKKKPISLTRLSLLFLQIYEHLYMIKFVSLYTHTNTDASLGSFLSVV